MVVLPGKCDHAASPMAPGRKRDARDGDRSAPPRPRRLRGRQVPPYAKRRIVGPFIFLAHMGPVRFEARLPRSVDVRPHPHIGLATVTYLFEGEVMHRDSVGSEQSIRPGEVNWMIVGHRISHSERSNAQAGSPHARNSGNLAPARSTRWRPYGARQPLFRDLAATHARHAAHRHRVPVPAARYRQAARRSRLEMFRAGVPLMSLAGIAGLIESSEAC